MKALLLTGGECPPPPFLRRLASGADLVIAADSGLDAAKSAGIVPDLVVGDFDSLSDRSLLAALPADRVREYPVDKDDTDTEIALLAAVERGADYIIVAGGGGGRLDHLLAIASLFRRGIPPREWHTGQESVYFLDEGESARFESAEGETVSVSPAGGGGSQDMDSEGLRWPLKGLVWDPGGFGISNRSGGDSLRISAGTAPLLVILRVGRVRVLQ